MDILDTFLERMAVIVYGESRPCSFKDFINFELNGVPYKYTHGTIRNVFSILRKQGKIEKTYNSIPSFYTLKGIKFGKQMTPNHTENTFNNTQSHFSQWLRGLPVKENPDVHDVNLGFKAKAIWNIASKTNSNIIANKDEKNNKDITLKKIFHENLEIIPTIHHTNNVSIVVACTDYPIPIDYYGTLRLTTGLSRAEERLRMLYEDYLQSTEYRSSNWIPSHMDWIVKMWHFNHDSAYGYGGERFEMYWKEALGVFRVYSKKSNKI
ncbi:MAG: hypothetical protein L0H53_08385 [Candidatus Nitrosocosmicus sp.]|nr:hypothetical protein [Candidatus Nitrosocosmicus sp.]MDN5866106.1 hypothetical protein [Candidatus Nitrosocosmicus sp.]